MKSKKIQVATIQYQTKNDKISIKSNYDLYNWEQQCTRTVVKITSTGPKEINFRDLQKGDRFTVWDDDTLVKHENGETEFTAASDPWLAYSEILMIEIEPC